MSQLEFESIEELSKKRSEYCKTSYPGKRWEMSVYQ